MINLLSPVTCAALAMLLAGCDLNSEAAKAPLTEPQKAVAIQSRAVLFVGGSVTQGAWASPGKDYASFISGWLTEKFGSVKAKNIAVGGTDSRFAVYRLEQDLDGFRPDIAFVEFSVNDRPDRTFVYENIDGLIYKLRRINPNVVIVYLAVTQPDDAAIRRAGGLSERAVYAREIVEKNGAIFVDAGFHLWHHVNLTNRNPLDFFADAVHPNDLGHSSYFLSISQQLDERIATVKGAGARSSLYIGQSRLDTARLVNPLSLITNTTCLNGTSSHLEFVGQPVPYDDLQYQCRPGDGFIIAFDGTSLGMTARARVGGGKLECTIDDEQSSLFHFEDNATRLRVTMLYEHRRVGSHIVSCKANGGLVEFGQFLVSSANSIQP